MTLDPDLVATMREADVRAEIIDPLIARLGYAFGQTNYVQRERSLRYPKGFIGHKSKRDLPLGAADYVCGIDGRRGSFTIEAKKGAHAYSLDDIEQAHSYAAHPEIRADFFVLCNGIDFRIFETLRKDAKEPIVCINLSQIDFLFYKIEAILSPDKLERNCNRVFDTGKPIANRYGSEISFYGGFAKTTAFDFHFDAPDNNPVVLAMANKTAEMKKSISDLIEYPQPIRSGLIGRYSDGRIYADVIFGSVHPKLEHNLISLGLHEATFFTDAESLDGEIPVSFETMRMNRIPVGTQLYPHIKSELEKSAVTTDFDLYINCLGHFKDGIFSGEYDGICIYNFTTPMPTFTFPNLIANIRGVFEIELSLN